VSENEEIRQPLLLFNPPVQNL